jgi:hypothetical protein
MTSVLVAAGGKRVGTRRGIVVNKSCVSERGNELQVELTSHHRIFDLQGHFAASRQGTDHILGSKWHQPRQNSQLLNMATCSHLGGSNINTILTQAAQTRSYATTI